MKNKVLTLCIAAALAASPIAALAEIQDIVPVNTENVLTAEDTMQSTYAIKQLVVKQIEEKDEFGIFIVTNEKDNEESIIHLNVNDEASLVFDNRGNAKNIVDIKEGDELTIYTRGNKPMIMIYPPQYTPDVIIINNDEIGSVNVDTYNMDGERLINSEKSLVLNVSDETPIQDAKGNELNKDDLDNKDLVVFYSMATFSIPPQTTPTKIVVLNNETAPTDELEIKVTDELVVNGQEMKIDIVSINGKDMIPVRKISEALGLDVGWDGEREVVTVGTIPMGVNFSIGTDSYSKARMTPFVLGQAPVKVIFEEIGVTYVPVKFFTEVLNAEVTVDNSKTIINL